MKSRRQIEERHLEECLQSAYLRLCIEQAQKEINERIFEDTDKYKRRVDILSKELFYVNSRVALLEWILCCKT